MACFEMTEYNAAVTFPDHSRNVANLELILGAGARQRIGEIRGDALGVLWSWFVGERSRGGFLSARAAAEDAMCTILELGGLRGRGDETRFQIAPIDAAMTYRRREFGGALEREEFARELNAEEQV